MLGFARADETPAGLMVEGRWEHDGIVGEELSWSVGYGPRTAAWLLKPAGVDHALPGMLALHDHGGFKFWGKEKIADGPQAPRPEVIAHRAEAYGGRAIANALAREGYAVLVHDTFLWGSRRFPAETMPESIHVIARAAEQSELANPSVPAEVARYNAAASLHEHLVEKYCTLLGTTLAGIVCYEDRVALNYLRSRPDVIGHQIGCIGLSGGGCRSALLLATHSAVAAAVIAGMMSTYAHLLDHNVVSHTWMFFPSEWARQGDWSDLAACRAPVPLLVQYDTDDALFTLEGMRAAHERIAGHYRSTGHSKAYEGRFYPGPHKLDLAMQADAFAWLAQALGRDGARPQDGP